MDHTIGVTYGHKYLQTPTESIIEMRLYISDCQLDPSQPGTNERRAEPPFHRQVLAS